MFSVTILRSFVLAFALVVLIGQIDDRGAHHSVSGDYREMGPRYRNTYNTGSAIVYNPLERRLHLLTAIVAMRGNRLSSVFYKYYR